MTPPHAETRRPTILRELARAPHAVVEASAGTGKTFTLEHLVMDLILSGAPFESLLVVTFTEKAAGELKTRLRRKLGRLLAAADAGSPGGSLPEAWPLDEAARDRLSRALLGFDRASVSTIHAFCQRVLTENAFAHHRPFRQRLVDERSTFERAFRTVLRTELAREAEPREWLERWLEHRSLDALVELVFTCRSRGGRFRPMLDVGRAKSALHSLSQAPTHPRAVRAMMVRGGLRGRVLADVLGQVSRLAELGAEAHGDLPRFLQGLDTLTPSFSLSELAATLEGAADRQPSLQHLASAVGELALASPSFDSAVVQVILPRVARQAQAEKAARGELDFSDMLTLMEDSLYDEGSEPLVATLRSRYPVALIDEFQDTDRSQWRIFRRLFLDEGATGRLFVIGDPKQAIYGFRGAEVRTYLRARAEIEAAGGLRVRLAENYRSSPRLIQALEALFDPGAPEPFFPGPISFEPVTAGRDVPSAIRRQGQWLPPALLMTPELGEGRPTVARIELLVADRIAREVRSLLSSASELVIGDEARRLRPQEIFVLTRSVREARRVAEALSREGVPVALLAPEDVLRSHEARDVLALLGAMAQPHVESLRLRAWSTPFFEVPTSALAGLRDLDPGDPRMARLLAWKALADRRDYVRLFRAILEESQIVERQAFLDDSRKLTNYLHVFELMESEASRGHPPLDELQLRLNLYVEGRARPETEETMERLPSDRPAVQVMTMHKAKGLEAEVVFLFGGAREVPSDIHHVPTAEGMALHLGSEAPPEARAETDAEIRRLLYVALTRARTQLYVPCFDGLDVERLGGLQAVLEPHLARARDTGQGWGVAREPPSEGDEPEGAPIPGPVTALLAPPRPPSPPREGFDPRARPLVTSYSRLKAEQGGHATPRRLDPEVAVDRRDERPTVAEGEDSDEALLPAGAPAGRALHEVLEIMDLRVAAETPLATWSIQPEVKTAIERALARHRLDPGTAFAPAAELLHRAVTTPLHLGDRSLAGGLAAADEVVREMEFLFPLPPRPEDGFVKGFIDVVFMHEGKVWVADWKSDALPDYGPEALDDYVRSQYLLQAEIYAIAVARTLGLSTEAEHEARFGGVLYVFLRGLSAQDPRCGQWHQRPTWKELIEASARLDGGRG